MSNASPMDYLCIKMECDEDHEVSEPDPDSESCDNDDPNDEDYVCTAVKGRRFTAQNEDNAQDEAAQRAKLKRVKMIQHQNAWTLSLFEAWAKNRSVEETEQYQKVDKPLHEMDDDELNFWLSRFIREVRKQNGDPYNVWTLKSISKALQSNLILKGKNAKILTDVKYAVFKRSFDAEIKRLRDMTVWSHGITAEEEEYLWVTEALGSQDPQTLLTTIVYLNGKHFGLTSGLECRALNPSNITFGTRNGVECIRFSDPKTTSEQWSYPNLKNPERCHVKLCKLYLSKCPPLYDFFYAMPLVGRITDKRWYHNKPVGHNALTIIISGLCRKVGRDAQKGHLQRRKIAANNQTSEVLKRKNKDEELSLTRKSSSADGLTITEVRSSDTDTGVKWNSEPEVKKFIGTNAVYYFTKCKVTVNTICDKR